MVDFYTFQGERQNVIYNIATQFANGMINHVYLLSNDVGFHKNQDDIHSNLYDGYIKNKNMYIRLLLKF